MPDPIDILDSEITISDATIRENKMIVYPSGDRMSLYDANGFNNIIDDISHYLMGNNNIMQAFNEFFSGIEATPDIIISCNRFPFTLMPTSTYTKTSLKISDTMQVNFTSGKGGVTPTHIIHGGVVSLTDVFPYGLTNFVTFTNTTIQIYIPFIGYVDIAPIMLMKDSTHIWKYLHLVYVVDYVSGSALACLMVNDTANITEIVVGESRSITGIMIYQNECTIGIPWTFRTSRDRQERLTNGVGALAGIATTIAGIATSNPVMTAGGAVSIASNTPGIAKSGNVSISGSVGSSTMSFAFLQPIMRIVTDNIDWYRNSDYQKYKGFPVRKDVLLQNVSGYVTVDEIHLEGFNNATSEELDLIETALKEGVILDNTVG